ncbi:hypothetical protein [Actinobacillus equuli]|uniref:hypothetical protein n=1 Tax=Actinobacillus equuli TaxID=718 RepID=UPI0024185893|nr:hypothetical protein [Actinobacillus equuli]MDG4953659.1 hypothetical protein [Actinobacillus equuli subsp. equuli]
MTNPTEIDLMLQHLEQSTFPDVGRVRSINFVMKEENERYFYAISLEKVGKLRKRLGILANRLKDNEKSYGFLYAERNFYIGDRLIFSWKNEVNI